MAEQRSAKAVGIIPELEPHCGSWIITSDDDSLARETFSRSTAEQAALAGWNVETAAQYLARINYLSRRRFHGVA